MKNLSKRFTLVAVVGVVVAAAGVTGALAATGQLAGSDQQPANVTSEVSSTLRAHYALLRRAATAEDALPRNAVGAAEYGQNAALARRVGDSGYYAVPGADDSLCLLTSVGGGICGRSPTEPTILTSGVCKDGRADLFQVVGLFPDGVAQVSVAAEDGSVDRMIDVNANGANATFARTDSRLTIAWKDADGGERSLRLPVPLGPMYCGEDTPPTR